MRKLFLKNIFHNLHMDNIIKYLNMIIFDFYLKKEVFDISHETSKSIFAGLDCAGHYNQVSLI